MTSKEAFEKIDWLLGLNISKLKFDKKCNSTIEMISCLWIIEKDLEVLEILKHHIHLIDSKVKNDSIELEVAFIEASGFVIKNRREYDLLKDWVIHND